jgi:polysaccharide deacetylase family sporulation protein PdaB
MFEGGISMGILLVRIRRKDLVPLLFIAVVIILVIINSLLAKEYLAPVSNQYRDDIPIYSVECEGKKCAITFDCAWGADDIPNILDTLDKYNAKATFFIVGLWAKKYPEMVKLMDERGHEVANHGYSHLHMGSIPENKIREEIDLCSDILEELTGKRVTLFRPPYGEYTSTTVKTARRTGYQVIQWDVDSLDWKDSMSEQDIYNRVIKRTDNGSIILFHNDTKYTGKVLPSILENLTANGFECVTVSDILLKGDYKIRFDGRQIKD